MGIAVVGALGVSGSVAHKMRILVFGPTMTDTSTIGDYTERLAHRPEYMTLAEVCGEMLELLEVGQAILWLRDDLKRQMPVFVRGVPASHPVPSDGDLPRTLLVRATLQDAQVHPVFEHIPWAEVVAPLISNKENIGLLVLGPKVPDNYFHSRDVAFISQMVASMSITAENIHLFEASRAMSRELLRVRVREWERMQLATRLHDEPLQQITLIAGALDSLAEEGANNGISDDIHHQRIKLLEVTRQLRSICADLHPPILDQGLVAAVEGILYEFELQNNVVVERNLHISMELNVAESIVIAIYHILTEALSNVRKHAQASKVEINLSLQDDYLILSIADDGVSIKMTDFAMLDLFRNHHFGMVGMHEWARSVEGGLSIYSRPGAGTTIVLSIPISHPNHFAELPRHGIQVLE